MQSNLNVTEAAITYIKKKVSEAGGSGLRISIKKTGCSGYSYLPSIVTTVNGLDTAIQIEDGVMIYLDSTWLHLLDDIEIDFIEDEKSGLKQKKLVFKNTKESGRCGCGESFHIE
ncbi:MAG TPA: iron-sulfur cluster assembly accessory protein [Gammaproteobacteria bacterium]|jgi:iron-sulfur cluster assembly accessory protein|nr:iron-sulfur cluster assembly accessory protein [Gammaproteobacteria bacterium]